MTQNQRDLLWPIPFILLEIAAGLVLVSIFT